jgi:hypothetical protein
MTKYASWELSYKQHAFFTIINFLDMGGTGRPYDTLLRSIHFILARYLTIFSANSLQYFTGSNSVIL